MRKVGKSRRDQKIPRVPLWLSFLFALAGQKNQGSPFGLFFYQLKGVSQKIDFFQNFLAQGGSNPLVPPVRIYGLDGISHSRLDTRL